MACSVCHVVHASSQNACLLNERLGRGLEHISSTGAKCCSACPFKNKRGAKKAQERYICWIMPAFRFARGISIITAAKSMSEVRISEPRAISTFSDLLLTTTIRHQTREVLLETTRYPQLPLQPETIRSLIVRWVKEIKNQPSVPPTSALTTRTGLVFPDVHKQAYMDKRTFPGLT